jgi:MoaE-MoaD fusion protein
MKRTCASSRRDILARLGFRPARALRQDTWMVVRVRLFAALRERAGRDQLELELPDGALVSDALAAVADLAADLPLVLAVNREYAARDDRLAPGDELALIPPVSGGAATAPHVAVRSEPLSLDTLAAAVRDPRAGAVVTFSGVTRDVDHLDYEAYAEMAAEQIEAIVAAAIERHGLTAAAAEHRIGRVPRSEASVVVAASAAHRAEAFAGAREIIDEIKRRVPIWKREEGQWVRGQAPPTPR